jgi:hypothetical protein
MQTYWGSTRTNPVILNLGNRRNCVVILAAYYFSTRVPLSPTSRIEQETECDARWVWTPKITRKSLSLCLESIHDS